MNRTRAAIVACATLLAALAVPAGSPAQAAPPQVAPAEAPRSAPAAVVPVGHGTPAAPAASGRGMGPRTLAGQPAPLVDAPAIAFVGLAVDCDATDPTRTRTWVVYQNNSAEVQQVTFAFSAHFLEPTAEGTFSYPVPAGQSAEFGFFVAGGASYRFWERTIAPNTDTMFATYDCATGNPFTDSDYFDHTFGMEIDWMFHAGIATGWPEADGTRTYRGLQSMARNAMAAFLYRLYGQPDYTPPAQPTFTDVPVGAAFHKEIEWLASVGVTKGWDVGGGAKEFRPYSQVNRDAMAAFLHRFSVLEGFPPHTPAPDAAGFVDVPPAMEHYDAMMWMRETGISLGWTTGAGQEFRPLTPVARDALAAFVFRYTDHTSFGPKA